MFHNNTVGLLIKDFHKKWQHPSTEATRRLIHLISLYWGLASSEDLVYQTILMILQEIIETQLDIMML